ncbi:nucleotide-diphospho-sugar transferase [Teratosphaeria nubilosa]|uniref:Nucleotide-diphospho-sugar transferase n=1 Tax=Teratosphaeria nubilosa TaxID=161662 RepID=A0A6G1L1L4_9PEZI|nr:nucleotide-diphospho-sugar transferase [Teratosphaeria nubilosa]
MAGAKKYAYTTLITRASYLAGVIILAQTLKRHGSKYPLVVYYTTNVKPDAIKALELEAPNLNLILEPCEQLLPRENVKVHLIAERFADTWTKLRVFDAAVFGYDAVCYLDADMAIFKNMDSVFSHADDLPVDWIAANHACVCNLDKDAWAPEDWTKENCAYTPLQHPEALSKPTQPTLESRGTYHLLNSGMFLYHPSAELWDAMVRFFNVSEKLGTYKFPDQDFLADFFRNRWRGLGWQYNALKTMRYWHQNIWRDDEVVCLHYIVDKPWAARVNADGTAGFKGEDGVTHGWWWDEYASWVQAQKSSGDEAVLQLVGKHVAREDGTENSDPDMRAIAATTAQSFAGNKAPGEHETQENGHQQTREHPMKKKPLGERGHGAVVHSR